jgi:phosphoribosylformimino-5-aminoimidazole carboxamide ribonucleotide (ProFAR) isomerase
MSSDSEAVFVEVADGYEKEYAKKFIDQYGAFIVITNDAAAASDAAPALGGTLELGGGLDKGGAVNHSLGTWFWAICLIAVVGIATLAYFNRARLVPALQTANGNVVTGGARVSRKQAEAAVKSSAVSPPGDSFKSIMERVDDPQE